MPVTLPEVINNIISTPEGIQVIFRVSIDDGIPTDFLLAG